MKYKKLQSYQLECFQKKYGLISKNIILVLNDEEKKAYCILNRIIKANVEYWYAVTYF